MGKGESVFFVMLTTQQGKPVPMVDKNDNLVLYDTYANAEDDAAKNMLGKFFGYVIYEW